MHKFLILVLLQIAAGTIYAQDFYDLNKVQEVKIYFSFDNWSQVLDSLKQRGKDERVVGDVVVNGIRYDGVGIRFKGNSSYFNVRKTGSSKLPINIKLDYKDKEHKLPGGYETIKLSNVFRDPSFIREALSYEIANRYLPTPRANFARVYVNDELVGLYNSSESVDEKFLLENYGTNDGILFKCDPNWNAPDRPKCPKGDKSSLMYLGADTACYEAHYEIKSDHGWAELVELTRILKETPEQIESVLDVDRVLWMLAFNNVLVNLDSYTGLLCHNYYLYRDSTGVFHPVLWDMNLSLGGFRYTGLGNPLSNEEMQRMSPFIHYKEKNPKRPLITQLIKQPLYRKIYIAHVKTIVEDYLANGELLARARAMHSQIASEVRADQNKLYTDEAFQQNIKQGAKADKIIVGLEELMLPRTEYLTNHPLIKKAGPAISEVQHIIVGDEVGIQATLEDAIAGYVYFRYGIGEAFQRMELLDDGGHMDEVAADGIWGNIVPLKPGLQYYIVAEGEKTASLSPERASHEFYEVPIK